MFSQKENKEKGKMKKVVLGFLLSIFMLVSLTTFSFIETTTANPGPLRVTVRSGSHSFNTSLCYFHRGVTTVGWSFGQFPPSIILEPGQQASKTDDGEIMLRLGGVPLGFDMGYWIDNELEHITIGLDPPLEFGKWYTLPGSLPADAELKIEHIFDLECYGPDYIWLFSGQQGVPALDQHHNSAWGDNWCSPTSSAAALVWYAYASGNDSHPSYFQNLCPDYNGDHEQRHDWDDMYALADVLGNDYFYTSPTGGTLKKAKYTGTQKFVDDQGYGDEIMVEWYENPTFDDIKSNLDWGTMMQGDNCVYFSYKIAVLGVYWGDQGAHVMVARAFNDTKNADDTYNVGLMDPWTASRCNTVMKTDGSIKYAGTWGKVGNMVTITNRNYPLPYHYPEGKASTMGSSIEINGFACVVSGHTYVISASDFGDVRVVDGVVYGIPEGTVYNTTGTIYPFANGTVVIKDGTYFPVDGTIDIINGTQLEVEFRTSEPGGEQWEELYFLLISLACWLPTLA
jgi:hypothetical protein